MRAFIIMTALTCFALVGCSQSPPTTIEEARADWTAKIHKAIADPARADQVSAQAGQLIDEQRSLTVSLKSASERLADLNTDYATTPEQFMAAYSDYETKRKATLTRLKDGMFALRKQVSAEEWKKITK